MMKSMAPLLIALTLLSSAPAFSQDLNALPNRVQALWDALAAGESLRALDYVEEASRARFLEREPNNVMTASVVGIEFTENSGAVSVRMRTTVLVPQLGAVERTISEVWVWERDNWFLRVPEGMPETPFGGTAASGEGPPGRERDNRPRIEFLVDELNLGSHVQGDLVEGVIPFRVQYARGALRSIGTTGVLGSVPGLSFGAPEWIDEEEGRLPFTWDTTFVFADVDEVVAFAVRDRGRNRGLVPLMIVGDIEPRIRFTQVPEAVDMSEAGSFELIIENISHEPFAIMRPTSPTSEYHIEAAWPESFVPGVSGKVVVSYPADEKPTGTSLVLTFGKPVFGMKRLS